MKKCLKCNLILEMSLFNKKSESKDGKRSTCRSCDKIYNENYYKENKGNCLLASKNWRDNNKEKNKERHVRYRDNNKDKLSKYRLQYNINNKEKKALIWRVYRENNKDSILKKGSLYQKNNKGIVNAKSARRRASKIKATPKWLTKEQSSDIIQIYKDVQDIQWLSEEPFEVDHIIPLQGKNVCGLHVPWNLQILTRSENRIKSRNYIND